QKSKVKTTTQNFKLSKEELDILRTTYRFPEIVREAAEKFSPNLVANFALDLAQKYNLFYNTHRVLEAETKDQKQFRLLLTASTAQLLKNCLTLLGIQTPERM
ncbi:MAG: arginine--tRNA ligase, partial [Candidatus Wildermuthbacteria bacterium]|nr:arginine--tRNA ligase [Candidatus Wildermuthbacteria bacterium]